MASGTSGFWADKYWLPRRDRWSDLPTDFSHLVYPIYFAVPIFIFRIFFEAFVGLTLGHLLGYVPFPLWPQIRHHIFGGFAQPTRTKKVLETFWRFSAYTFLFIFGCIVLYDKSWLYDVRQCWIGYARHPLDTSIWWYYMIETAFYYSLLFTSIFDVRRSDFWQMTLHHVVTIGLLSFSWTVNFVRVGTLILLSHDVSDVLLELGKLVRYSRCHPTLGNVVFAVFFLTWIVTRLGYFPFMVVGSGLIEGAALIQPDYSVFNPSQVPYAPRIILGMLVCLIGLHIFWTVLIVKILLRSLRSGEASDVRSDSEEEPLVDKNANGTAKRLKTRKQLNGMKKTE
jgi:hypothetical protein